MKLAWEKSVVKTKEPRRIIQNMAYSKYDHVYLYAALITIKRDEKPLSKGEFAPGYQTKLKAAGLLHNEGEGRVVLTRLGQETLTYMDDHKAIIGQANIRFFGQTHLRNSLNNDAWKSGHTQRYFAEAGYLQESGNKLSQRGISARSYMNVLAVANSKRAKRQQAAANTLG